MSYVYCPNSEYEPLMTGVLIRRYQPVDLKAVVELDIEVFGGYDPQIFTTFYEYYPRTILVAESSGRVVGFILGFKHTPLEGRVFWLVVRPGYQHKGIGRRLMITLLKTFMNLGAVSTTLEVRISNQNAQALYVSLGFETVKIIPRYYSDGEAALIMRRHL